MTRNYEISHPSNKVSPLPLALPPAFALCRPVASLDPAGWEGKLRKTRGNSSSFQSTAPPAPLAASGGHGNQDVVQICQKSRRIGCVIPHCNLQRGFTQPILQLFGHICFLSRGRVAHSAAQNNAFRVTFRTFSVFLEPQGGRESGCHLLIR